MNTSITPQAKGLLFVTVGILGCALVGIPFLLRLCITYFSFMCIEYGLASLQLPTFSSILQKYIGSFYRS